MTLLQSQTQVLIHLSLYCLNPDNCQLILALSNNYNYLIGNIDAVLITLVNMVLKASIWDGIGFVLSFNLVVLAC